MPRPPRNFIENSYHHLVSRGNKKAEIFHESADYEYFLRLILKFKQEIPVSLFHYVLMPNHFHFQIRPDCSEGSKFIQKLKGNYAVYYQKKYATVGHVWQGRFKNKLIKNDAYLLASGNYIEMNPVRAGLVKDLGDWPYSSFHYYAKGIFDPLLDKSPFYKILGSSDKERKERYIIRLSSTRS